MLLYRYMKIHMIVKITKSTVYIYNKYRNMSCLYLKFKLEIAVSVD